MVDMGVGQQQAVQLAGRQIHRLIFVQVGALLHAAVDQQPVPGRLQQKAAARHFVRGAQKGQFHRVRLLCSNAAVTRPLLSFIIRDLQQYVVNFL